MTSEQEQSHNGGSEELNQADIDSLLGMGAETQPQAEADGGGASVDDGMLDQAGIDDLLGQLSGEAVTEEAVPGAAVGQLELPETAPQGPATAVVPEDNIKLLKDVNVKVKVELGRGSMYLRDILRLTHGSVVELEKLAGDPLDIYVNDRLIAKGEVLVLNENFCVRITEIFSPKEVLRLTG